MKLYSSTFVPNKDHRIKGKWVFDRYWNITKESQLDKIIKKLKSWTKYDKVGRVLCVGFPSKDMSLQYRVYIVKWGHNEAIWEKKCEYYNELVSKLIRNIDAKV